MIRPRLVLLLGLALIPLLSGCAEHVDLRVTTVPGGASLYYRIGTETAPNKPGQARTGWIHVGQTPLDRRVTLPPFWSDPGTTFELRAEKDGFKTATKIWEPASVRTDGANLTHHFVLETKK